MHFVHRVCKGQIACRRPVTRRALKETLHRRKPTFSRRKSELSLTTRAEAIRKSYVAGERPCRVGGTAQFRGVYVAHKTRGPVLTSLPRSDFRFFLRIDIHRVMSNRVNYHRARSDGGCRCSRRDPSAHEVNIAVKIVLIL